jgi:hypothetical protein
MHLCAFSKSDILASSILEACPLALTTTAAKTCPCKKRLYHVPPADLRVLSCTFPSTWKGEAIGNPEKLGAALNAAAKGSRKPRADKRQTTLHNLPTSTTFDEEDDINMEANENTELVNDLEADAARGGHPELVARPAPSRELVAMAGTVYDRISDPMAFVGQFGVALYESKMFGCANAHQGRVLAMACMCEGMNPLEVKRRYHIIGGQLAMRADAMLAEFRMKHHGTHEILERTPEVARIRLVQGSRECVASFTWEDAKKEPFVWAKSNEPKTNWATPRARMQMLWARVVSDAVRAFAPEVVSGVYTPEELGGGGDIEDAEFTVVKDGATPHAATTPAAEPKKRGRPAAAAQAPSANGETKPAGGETKPAPAETKSPPAETKPADAGEMSTAGETADPLPAKASKSILVEIKRLKDGLAYGDDMWKKILAKMGVDSATKLDEEGAEKLRHWLADKLKAKTGIDELSAWANGATTKGGGSAEEPPFQA